MLVLPFYLGAFPVQAATSLVNDSLLTTVCIQYRPGQVAAAVVYLSYLYMGLPRVDTTLLETDGTVVAGETDRKPPFVFIVRATSVPVIFRAHCR